MASRVGALIGKWKSLSCVWFFATPWTVHGILQARILEWVAFPFSRGSSQPRDGTQSSSLQVGSLPVKPQGKPKNTGVDSLFLLQGIFPTQGLNPGLPHCRWILYQLSYIFHIPRFYIIVYTCKYIIEIQKLFLFFLVFCKVLTFLYFDMCQIYF